MNEQNPFEDIAILMLSRRTKKVSKVSEFLNERQNLIRSLPLDEVDNHFQGFWFFQALMQVTIPAIEIGKNKKSEKSGALKRPVAKPRIAPITPNRAQTAPANKPIPFPLQVSSSTASQMTAKTE